MCKDFHTKKLYDQFFVCKYFHTKKKVAAATATKLAQANARVVIHIRLDGPCAEPVVPHRCEVLIDAKLAAASCRNRLAID